VVALLRREFSQRANDRLLVVVERIGEEKDLIGLYKTLGRVFRERCEGWTLWVFTANAFLARQIGLKPSQVIDLFNGRLPCRLLRYDNGRNRDGSGKQD
jgi:23S rRNA G2445 N2-methylase RlmL